MRRAGRLINFRLPVFAALALVCGAALAYVFMLFGVDYFYLLAALPVFAAALTALLIFTRSRRAVAAFAVIAAAFAAGAVLCALALADASSPPVMSGEFAYVTGRVEDVRRASSGGVTLVLSSASAGGELLKGDVLVYLDESAGGTVAPGYTVRVFGQVFHYDLIAYGSVNYRVVNGMRYYVDAHGAMEYSYGFSLFGVLRAGIYDMLTSRLDGETAAIAYAMITGSTQDISFDTLSAFRYGGVSHIFAVSGMNITLLYMSVFAVLRRTGVGRWPSACVCLAVIFVYTGMCGFTLSAVRAAIMCAVASLASLTRNKYDAFNSLAISVIIIVLVDPFHLFDVGFILSVCAMLGIILLAPPISRGLRRLPRSLADNIAMSLASQASTLPALLATFGYISGAGLILNIAVLPLLSLLYVLLFACVVLCAVIPPAAGVLLPAAALPLQAIVNFFVASGFEDSLVSGFGGWWLPIVVFVGIAALSDKFNLRRSLRAAAAGVCALGFVLGCVFSGAVFGGETRIVAGGYYGGGMVLVRSGEGTVMILVCDTYPGGIGTFAGTYAPGGVDDLIIVGGDECARYYYECGVDAQRVWLPPGSIALGGLDGAQVRYEGQFELYGTQYGFGDDYTLTAAAGGVTFAVCTGGYADMGRADVAFCMQPPQGAAANTRVCFNGMTGDFNLYSQGCLQFIANGGTLIMTGCIPEK